MNLTLDEWLGLEKGRAAKMAADFDVAPASISEWRQKHVPHARMKAVHEYTGGAVPYELMLPGCGRTSTPSPKEGVTNG